MDGTAQGLACTQPGPDPLSSVPSSNVPDCVEAREDNSKMVMTAIAIAFVGEDQSHDLFQEGWALLHTCCFIIASKDNARDS